MKYIIYKARCYLLNDIHLTCAILPPYFLRIFFFFFIGESSSQNNNCLFTFNELFNLLRNKEYLKPTAVESIKFLFYTYFKRKEKIINWDSDYVAKVKSKIKKNFTLNFFKS